MLKRFAVVLARHNSKLPIPSKEDKEKQAIQEVYDEEIERSKKVFDIWFPDPNKSVERKEYPKYPSLYGKSDEEDTPAFFLEDLKDYQYIYIPKDPIVFENDGFATVYQAKSRYFFVPNKLRYAWKLSMPIAFSMAISFNTLAYSDLSLIATWSIPFIILTQALMVRKIFLHKDGRQVKIEYKRFKLWPTKTKTFDISSFKEPSGNAFIFWSVYEFPDDLRTFNENPLISRISFAKNTSWWSFLLMPGNAVALNREVLINALNGIYIDTSQLGSEDLKSRYLILHPKKK